MVPLPHLLITLLWLAGLSAAADERPNILLILLDDLGKEWVGCYGAEGIETPQIDRLAATGVRNLVVVETADAVLVADRDGVQNVKEIVNRLKAQQRSEASLHHRVYRPWGSYESLIEGDRFQVKRITVNPGQRLSLQMHHHRSEHWIVVHGTAEVTHEERVFTLQEDESTYIPVGHKHRLANPGRIPLELIEVQTGSYLGEDDIVRFEDVYGRDA